MHFQRNLTTKIGISIGSSIFLTFYDVSELYNALKMRFNTAEVIEKKHTVNLRLTVWI